MKQFKEFISAITYISIIILSFLLSTYVSYKTTAIGNSTDSILYNDIAKRIITDGISIFGSHSSCANYTDIGNKLMPGYSLLLALIYLLFGYNVWNVIIFQLIFSLLASLLLWKLLSKIFKNKTIALIVTCWQIFYIELWHYNFLILIESTSVSLLFISFYFLFEYLQTKKANYFILYSFTSIILISINNRFIFHTFATYCYLFFHFLYFEKSELKNIIVGGFIVIVLLLPWHIRQYYVYNRIMLFSPEWTNLKKGDPLPKCNYQSYDQYYKSLTKNDLLHANNEYYIHLFTPQKLEEMKLKNTFNQKYPFITRAIGFFEIVRFDFRFGYGNDTRISPPNIYGPKQLIRTIYNLIFLGSMLLLMFPGIYYSIRQRNMFMKIIAVYIFTHIIIHSWAHYIERYRLTIVPLIFIIGWYGLIQLINNLSIIKQENNSKPEIR